jgi:hypothetical protein
LRDKAVKVVQKFLKGYVVRKRIEKEKEIREFLEREKEDDEAVGEELKLEDLSVSQRDCTYTGNKVTIFEFLIIG